jgi:hypothetical protein
MGADVRVVVQLFAGNARKTGPVVETLKLAADFAYAEASKLSTDMYGPVANATRAAVVARIGGTSEATSPHDMGVARRGGPAQDDALGAKAQPARPDDAQPSAQGGPAKFDLSSEASTAQRLADIENAKEQACYVEHPTVKRALLYPARGGEDLPSGRATATGQRDMGSPGTVQRAVADSGAAEQRYEIPEPEAARPERLLNRAATSFCARRRANGSRTPPEALQISSGPPRDLAS